MNDTTKTEKKIIAGVGSALVDVLIHESDEFVLNSGVQKGGMTYVEAEYIDKILEISANEPRIVPGGSACNTIMGIARLERPCRFIGKLGEDVFGNLFRTELEKNRVESVLYESPTPTGRVLSIITPDAQRSMLTFLGAAAELEKDEITDECLSSAAIVHIEGYLVFNQPVLKQVVHAAKLAQAKVSFDLASFNIVEESKTFLEDFVFEYVDILIANEDEAKAFTGSPDEQKSLEIMSRYSETVALKLGSRGSRIFRKGEYVSIDPVFIPNVVDTTGAGDLWAAGFLYGLVNNWSLKHSGNLASLCGCEVCKVDGANIPDKGWQTIHREIETWNPETNEYIP